MRGKREPYGRPSGAVEQVAAEHVRRDDEPLARVERRVRTDEPVPPPGCRVARPDRAMHVRVAGERMQHQNGVGPVSPEGPPRLVGDRHRVEATAELEVEPAHLHDVTITDRVSLPPGTAGGRELGT
jgi:hypothetical protein